MNEMNELIQNELKSAGASLVGFADLSTLPIEQTGGLKYGISFALAVDPKMFQEIHALPSTEYYEEYKGLNKRLGQLAKMIAELLESKGYRAKPHFYVMQDEASLSTVLPLKTVAVLAGIGRIGKSALLVTENFGSAVRLAAVLTDAPLDTFDFKTLPDCGSCMECKNACPAGAITGENWHPGAQRSLYYDAQLCAKTARALSSEKGIDVRICGKCIAACPYTKYYIAGSLN